MNNLLAVSFFMFGSTLKKMYIYIINTLNKFRFADRRYFRSDNRLNRRRSRRRLLAAILVCLFEHSGHLWLMSRTFSQIQFSS